MKNKLVVLCLMLTVISLVSCSKDAGSDTSLNTPIYLVKTYSQQLMSNSRVVSCVSEYLYYDSLKRLVTEVDSAYPNNTIIHTYQSEKQFSYDSYTSGVLQKHTTIVLNNNLNEDSSYYYDNQNDTTWLKYTYPYNGNGSIAEEKEVELISTNGVRSNKAYTYTYAYDGNGNVATAADNNGNTTTYNYYSDLKYNGPLFYSPIKTFYGNYLKDATVYQANKTAIDLFYYIFDNKNRLIMEKEVSSNGKLTLITNYTY